MPSVRPHRTHERTRPEDPAAGLGAVDRCRHVIPVGVCTVVRLAVAIWAGHSNRSRYRRRHRCRVGRRVVPACGYDRQSNKTRGHVVTGQHRHLWLQPESHVLGFPAHTGRVGGVSGQHPRHRARRGIRRVHEPLSNHTRGTSVGGHVRNRIHCLQAKGSQVGVRSNPSIERTVTSWLRPLVTAAHVKR